MGDGSAAGGRPLRLVHRAGRAALLFGRSACAIGRRWPHRRHSCGGRSRAAHAALVHLGPPGRGSPGGGSPRRSPCARAGGGTLSPRLRRWWWIGVGRCSTGPSTRNACAVPSYAAGASGAWGPPGNRCGPRGRRGAGARLAYRQGPEPRPVGLGHLLASSPRTAPMSPVPAGDGPGGLPSAARTWACTGYASAPNFSCRPAPSGPPGS